MTHSDSCSFMLELREGFLQLPRIVVGGFWSMKGGVALWVWPSDGQCFMLAALHTCLLLTSMEMLDARLPSTRTPRGCQSGVAMKIASWFIYVRGRMQMRARYKMIFLLGSFPIASSIGPSCVHAHAIGRSRSSGEALHLPKMILSGSSPQKTPAVPIVSAYNVQ